MRVVGEAEQVMGLDQLETLVHERRRVDRDLAAHVPGRVGERRLDVDVAELVLRHPAERPARGGQDQPVDAAGGFTAHQLEERRVLGVDRDHAGVRALGELHDELATDDEALLVGEREVHALAERRDRRAEPGRADESVQDEVCVRFDDQANHALGSREHLSPAPGVVGALGGAGLRERNPRHAVLDGLRQQALPRLGGGEPHDFELFARTHDLERLLADRAGRAEDHELPHWGQSRESGPVPGRTRVLLEERLRDVVADHDREEGGIEAVERAAVLAEEACRCPSRRDRA